MGDFNFYRSLENRNKPGGSLSDTLIFNDALGHLGLIELQLKGRAFTWSNMQENPLLEQLDWFFMSVNWTIQFPKTEVLPWLRLPQITSHARLSLILRSLALTFFVLRTFGYSMLVFRKQFKLSGSPLPLLAQLVEPFP